MLKIKPVSSCRIPSAYGGLITVITAFYKLEDTHDPPVRLLLCRLNKPNSFNLSSQVMFLSFLLLFSGLSPILSSSFVKYDA